MTLSDILTSEVLAELGILDHITEEKYASYKAQIEEIAEQRIISLLYNDLSEDEKKELEKLTNEGKDMEIAAILIRSPKRKNLLRREMMLLIEELTTI